MSATILRLSFLAVALALPALSLPNPPLLDFATHLGPAAETTHVVLDQYGYVYISGFTLARQFPCSNPPASALYFGFVMKLAPHGDATVWSICFAGPVGALAIDSAYLYAAVNVNGSSLVQKLDQNTGTTISSLSII